MGMLVSDPPYSYAAISAALGSDREHRAAASPLPGTDTRVSVRQGLAEVGGNRLAGVQVLDGWNDEQLLVALSEAMKARAAVPAWFTETARTPMLAQHRRRARAA